MSVLNIAFGANAVRCLTDTLEYTEGQPSALIATKCQAMPGGFALVVRGQSVIGRIFETALREVQSVDEAERELPPDIVRAALPSYYDREMGVEVTIIGWSKRRRRLAVLRADYQRMVVEDLEPGRVYLWPRPATGYEPPRFDPSEGQMIRLALHQKEVLAKFGGSRCIGGLMHMTTVTRDFISQRIAGEYPGYADLARRFGDPNAQAYATWRAAGGELAA